MSSDQSNTNPSMLIDQVMFDPSIYPRIALNEDRVKEYAKMLDQDVNFDPIILDQHYRILDGRTRWEAHKICDRQFISYNIRTVANDREAFLIACQLNSKHGARLSIEDKKKSCREIYQSYCTEFKAPSSKDLDLLARSLGINVRTVYKWCKDLTHEIHSNRAEVMNSDKPSVQAAKEIGITRHSVYKFKKKHERSLENLNGEQKARELISKMGKLDALNQLTQSRRGCEAAFGIVLDNLKDKQHPFHKEFRENAKLFATADKRLSTEHQNFGITLPVYNEYVESIRAAVPACEDLLSDAHFTEVIEKGTILHNLKLKDQNLQNEFFKFLLPLIQKLQDVLSYLDPVFATIYRIPRDREFYYGVLDMHYDVLAESLEQDHPDNTQDPVIPPDTTNPGSPI